MKDPERLKDTCDALGRSVLLASDETLPPAGAKNAVLANVLAMAASATALAAVSTSSAASSSSASTATSAGGASATATGAGATSATATGAGATSATATGAGMTGAGASGAAATGAAAAGKAALIKWLVVGGIGLSAAGGAVLMQSRADAPPGVETSVRDGAGATETRAAEPVTERPQAEAPVAEPPRAEAPAAPPPDEALAGPQPEGASRAPSTAAVSPRAPRHAAAAPETPAPAPVASGLLEESAALGEARSMLRSGNAEGALTALREMDRRFPGGALAQERTVLTVEALAATGRAQEAASIAKRFIEAHPTSPLAGRLAPYAGP